MALDGTWARRDATADARPAEGAGAQALFGDETTEQRVAAHRRQVMDAVHARQRGGEEAAELTTAPAPAKQRRPLGSVVKGLATAKRERCALCRLEFWRSNLPGETTRSAITRLRRRWGLASEPKHTSATYYYGAVPLCLFCMQFFDADGRLPGPRPGTGRARPVSPAFKFFIGRDAPVADVQAAAAAVAAEEEEALATPRTTPDRARVTTRATAGASPSRSSRSSFRVPLRRVASEDISSPSRGLEVSDEDLGKLGAAAKRLRAHMSRASPHPPRHSLFVTHTGSPMRLNEDSAPPSPVSVGRVAPSAKRVAAQAPVPGGGATQGDDGAAEGTLSTAAARPLEEGSSSGSGRSRGESEAAEANSRPPPLSTGGEASSEAARTPPRVSPPTSRASSRLGFGAALGPSPRHSPPKRPSPPTALPSRTRAIGAMIFSEHELQGGGLFDSSTVFRSSVVSPTPSSPLGRRTRRSAVDIDPASRTKRRPVPPDVNTHDNTTNAGAVAEARRLREEEQAEELAREQERKHGHGHGHGRGNGLEGGHRGGSRAGGQTRRRRPSQGQHMTPPAQTQQHTPPGRRRAAGGNDHDPPASGHAAAKLQSAGSSVVGAGHRPGTHTTPRAMPLEPGRARIRGAADGHRSLRATDLFTSGPGEGEDQQQTSELVQSALTSPLSGSVHHPQGPRARGREAQDPSLAMLMQSDWVEPARRGDEQLAERRPLLVDYHLQRLRNRKQAAGMQQYLATTRTSLRASSERMFVPHDLERRRHRVEAQRRARHREAALEKTLERSLSEQLRVADARYGKAVHDAEEADAGGGAARP